MIIASKKRKENIAEYILYMWQIEDMIRANDFDISKIRRNIKSTMPRSMKWRNGMNLLSI